MQHVYSVLCHSFQPSSCVFLHVLWHTPCFYNVFMNIMYNKTTQA